jgi:hypothetical protein
MGACFLRQIGQNLQDLEMGQDSTDEIHATLGYFHQRGSADWNRATW